MDIRPIHTEADSKSTLNGTDALIVQTPAARKLDVAGQT